MADRSESPKAEAPRDGTPVIDRRAAAGSAAPLKQLKGMLDRPLRMANDGGKLRVTLVERRQTPAGDLTYLLTPLRNELRARLGASPHGGALVLRHLLVVHKVLGAKGWAGLDTLPAAVLAKGLDQTEMLHDAEPSPLLEVLTAQLRIAHTKAAQRESRLTPTAPAADLIEDLQVSETTHEDFEAMQKSWFATLSSQEQAGNPGSGESAP